MTPTQIDLARHALGLPNRQRRSYRNRFVAGPGHDDFFEWCLMVVEGNATYRAPHAVPFGGDAIFYLTWPGASDALRPRERLDPEDFPNETAPRLPRPGD